MWPYTLKRQPMAHSSLFILLHSCTSPLVIVIAELSLVTFYTTQFKKKRWMVAMIEQIVPVLPTITDEHT